MQHPACSPHSIEAKVEDSCSKTDGSRSSGSDSVESDKYVAKLESPQKKESQGTTRVSPLPIPPKSQGLSPEVISPSISPNLEQESVCKQNLPQTTTCALCTIRIGVLSAVNEYNSQVAIT